MGQISVADGKTDGCGREMMRLGIAKSEKTVIMDNGSHRMVRRNPNRTVPVGWDGGRSL